MLLEMAAEGAPDRVAIGSRRSGTTYQQMLERTRRVAGWLAEQDGTHVAALDVNSEAIPLLLFGAGRLGRPFAPLNYRMTPGQLRGIVDRLVPVTLLVGDEMAAPSGSNGAVHVATRADLARVAMAEQIPDGSTTVDPEAVAVLLFTSGTTGEPKAAVLRHRHLVSYIISTVEFLGAGEEEAALVSVPPYHVAGLSALLSSVYAGRRVVQLEAFDADRWVDAVEREAITHAMVVPTMLSRILDAMTRRRLSLPSLRHLSYGGGRMPVPTVERALQLLPGVGFVNAYGLTETSSTIAVLGPEEHRQALQGATPDVRRRLGSVGRPLPTLELEIRSADGAVVACGESGEIHVRGEQVSGEYVGRSALDGDGWFATRDGGFIDADGYLFVEGRLDDVIVRGGENLSPGEIEEALLCHPAVAEVGVVGIPDPEWGEQVAAAVVLADGGSVEVADLQHWVRSRLRSSRTPGLVVFVTELPYNEGGKLLRRALRTELGLIAHPGSTEDLVPPHGPV